MTEKWVVTEMKREMGEYRARYEYWRNHAIEAEQSDRPADARILNNAAQRCLDECVRIQLSINALTVELCDGDGHELDTPDVASLAEVMHGRKAASIERENEREDNNPARQHREGL